jgi:hypothetical protein
LKTSRRVIHMRRADKEFKAWYEKESGKKVPEAEFEEIKSNLLEFAKILGRWHKQPQRACSNSEVDEHQLVDE